MPSKARKSNRTGTAGGQEHSRPALPNLHGKRWIGPALLTDEDGERIFLTLGAVALPKSCDHDSAEELQLRVADLIEQMIEEDILPTLEDEPADPVLFTRRNLDDSGHGRYTEEDITFGDLEDED